jgi:S-formylglutathione hydrolase FrmB
MDVPLVILLHGVYGSHWNWALSGRAHLTLQRLIEQGEIRPLVLAMPSDGLWGDGSGYWVHREQNFERWIVDDVPTVVMETVPQVSAHSPLFIAGLSMGGFGALRLGAKYARRFSGISGHSSITRLEEMAGFVEESWDDIPADPAEKRVIDVCMANRADLPPIRFDCGAEDALLEANRLLSRQLQQAGIDHLYEEFPGGHEWPYWETHLVDTLRFFHSILNP